MKLKNAAIVIPSLFITMLFTQSLFAQVSGDSSKQAEKGDAAIAQVVTTKDGRCVILNTNGTWQYKTTAPGSTTASAIETVRAYLMASYVTQRIPFVLNPDKVKPLMESHYGKRHLKVSKFEILTDTEPTPTKTGFVKIDVEIGDNVYDYYLKKTKDGYRIDWEEAVGYNPVSAAEFIIKEPTTPAKFRVIAKIGDNSDYKYPKKSYWCIGLQIDDDKELVYVEKDTAMGQELYKTLQDGKWHEMILELESNPNANEGIFQHFRISKVINSDGWLLEQHSVK